MAPTLRTLGILAALICLVAGLALISGPVVSRVSTETLIRLVAVIGLWVFVGNSGILSFGHATFAAIGAYAAAWLTMPSTAKSIFLPSLPEILKSAEYPLPVGLLAGVAVAALAGLLLGAVIVRLSGIAASIATLAWLSIVVTVYSNADSWTKGTSSLVGLPLTVGPVTALIAALVALLAAFWFRRSRFGLMLVASREDEVAARASAIDVWRMRLIAFVLSAAVVAMGGVLQGHFVGVLSIGQFYLEYTFLTLAILVVGGVNSLSGAVLGCLVISAASELLRTLSGGLDLGALTLPALPGLRELCLAAIMLAILLFRPRGLLGDRELGAGRRRPG